MDDGVKGNLKNTDVWMRLFFIVVMYALYGVARVVLFLVVVFQFLSTLFTGKTNTRLLGFGKQLSEYIYQVVQYLTYTSDEKPFPFADWPQGEQTTPAKKTPAAKKKAAKKKAAKPKAEPEPEPEPEPESKPVPEGEEGKENKE